MPAYRTHHLFVATSAHLAPSIHILHHILPKAMFLLDQPIDQRLHLLVNSSCTLPTHVSFKGFADPLALEQIEHATQANRLIKELIATSSHLQDDLLYFAQAMKKAALHIFAIELQLLLNGLDRASIFCQELCSLLDHLLDIGEQVLYDSKRAQQFQAHTFRFVQRLEEIGFYSAKAALFPQ